MKISIIEQPIGVIYKAKFEIGMCAFFNVCTYHYKSKFSNLQSTNLLNSKQSRKLCRFFSQERE